MKSCLFPSLFAILCLAACGFQPMYGSHSAMEAKSPEAASALSDIDIAIIPDREGQLLRNELVDQLHRRGTPENPRYRLTFSKLAVNIRELDLTKSSEATRAQVRASITMNLVDARTGETLLTRAASSVSSYNILPSEFATNVTEDNARVNAVKDIARQIQLQLSLYFNR